MSHKFKLPCITVGIEIYTVLSENFCLYQRLSPSINNTSLNVSAITFVFGVMSLGHFHEYIMHQFKYFKFGIVL